MQACKHFLRSDLKMSSFLYELQGAREELRWVRPPADNLADWKMADLKVHVAMGQRSYSVKQQISAGVGGGGRDGLHVECQNLRDRRPLNK